MENYTKLKEKLCKRLPYQRVIGRIGQISLQYCFDW